MQNLNKREALEFYAVIVLGILGAAFVLWQSISHPHMVVKYDCSIAEISPDYPVAVREGCRKLMSNNK